MTNLEETVNEFWHELENKYPKILPSVAGVKDFNKHLKETLSGNDQKGIAQIEVIANNIRTHLLDEQRKKQYAVNDFERILDYLKDKIP